MEEDGAAYLRLCKVGREGDLHRVALIGEERQRLALEHPEPVAFARRLVDVESGDGNGEMASIPCRKRPLHLIKNGCEGGDGHRRFIND